MKMLSSETGLGHSEGGPERVHIADTILTTIARQNLMVQKKNLFLA